MFHELFRAVSYCCRACYGRFCRFFMQGLGTSIDALAVGVTFAVLPEIDIRFAALSIGFVTAVLCVLAVGIGHKFGTKIGSKAEYLGGIILILLGCKILLEHLEFFI